MNLLRQRGAITSLKAGESSWNNLFYARPHPGPLPRGEGETVAAFWQKVASWFMGSRREIFWGNLTPALSRRERVRVGMPKMKN